MEQQIAEKLIEIGLNIVYIFIGIVVALWYENRGASRLQISPGRTEDEIKYNNLSTRFLRLRVTNLPRKKRLVSRQTAYSCHGTVTFFTLDRKQIGNPMPIRWDGNPEPIKYEVLNGKIVTIPELSLMRSSRYIDIPPDETESLAVAVRIVGETTAYGWTSESYFKSWRHPEYELPAGKYFARIVIITGDSTADKEFQFNNPEEFEGFDLIQSP